MHYLLFYEYVPDVLDRRPPHREAHLRHAREALARGELVLGGAFADPVDGALIVFRGDSPRVAEQFAQDDPYVKAGLVTRWHVRAWTPIVGGGAAA